MSEPLDVQPDAELMLLACDGGVVARPVLPRGPVGGQRSEQFLPPCLIGGRAGV